MVYSTSRLCFFAPPQTGVKIARCCQWCSVHVTSNITPAPTNTFHQHNHLKVEGIVCVRHQAVLVGALQLEAMGDHSIRRAVLAIAVEFGQTVAVSKLLKILVGAVNSTGTKVLHYA